VNSNIIQGNNNGIYFTSSSSSNIIYDNTLSDNSYGVKTHISDSNTFHHNKFLENNVENAHDSNTNSWVYNSEGNYWSDYSDYDDNGDGIGDSPYIIPGGVNQDDYPLGYFLTLDPVAYIESISPNPADEGQSISFNGYGTPSDKIINWEWKANGDLISNSEDFSTSSLSAGTYTISFRVQATDETWSDYAQRSLTINAEAVPQNQRPFAFIQTVDPTTTTYGEQIYFYGHGTDTDGMIVEFYWSSSRDGKIAGTQAFYKSDLSVGSHTIYFKVKDNQGDWSEYSTASVTVNPDTSVPNTEPVADAGGPYAAIVNNSITFDGSDSYDPDEEDSISTYAWSLGDGTTGTGVTIEHYYTSAGNYTVVLTVTDTHGSQSISTVTAVITEEDKSENGENNGDNDKFVIPGFEILIFILALVLILLFKKIK
jgi:parallel beta-helix repeat protein